jgi:beta-glucuronidase
MLNPKESRTREIKDLSGIWNFKIDTDNKGIQENWQTKPLTNTILMPVPASYNDITQNAQIRDHIGYVWYETKFNVPQRIFADKNVILRFGSATHFAIVWVNGREIIRHKGGFLPFEADITNFIDKTGSDNILTVAVNNELTWQTLPPGETVVCDVIPTLKKQEYHFDFFNYAGIHRPVKLIFRPKTFIDDISITTNVEKDTGIVNYQISALGKANCKAHLYTSDNKLICSSAAAAGQLKVQSPNLWDVQNPYLYKLKVELTNDKGELIDEYELPIGIRTIKVEGKKFLLNGKEVYFTGFGKHEDSAIRGRGVDNCTNVKDFNLLKWINANSFRTSHYPYSEEILNLADQYGILIIDECPAVGMYNFGNNEGNIFCNEHVNNETLQHHLDVMADLIKRDKNHPSVVMWSVANEAITSEDGSLPYFSKVINKTRQLDPSRPITMAQITVAAKCTVSQLLDVICVNRYFSWYIDSGMLDTIEIKLGNELRKWYERFPKPIIVSEYGADAIAGFHSDPPVMFSEEYQVEMINRFHKVFDSMDFIIGEHVWNFADFATKQGITRVMGNKKGVFTRDRQPKMIAHILKERWSKK